ncbi:hypothetical protein JCM21900_001680 [Sporobolomyces salmonicolor]
MSDSEPDFDDPRFLVDVRVPATDLSYADRRKRKLIQAEDKGRTKSRKQREEDAREEGLSTNLIARDTERGEESRGLRMMKAMGFNPGEALGRKPDEADQATPGGSAPPSAAAGSSRGGLGFSKASFAPAGDGSSPSSSNATPEPASSTAKRRTEPIQFELRAGRTGLGVPQPHARPRRFPSALLPDSTPLPDLPDFLARVRASMDEKRAFGLLRSLRRTCEELDRRAGVEDSAMWKDPDERARDERRERLRRTFERIDREVESDEEKDGEEKDERRRGALAYERGYTDTVVEVEEGEDQSKEEMEDEEEWFSMDVRTRLGLMLSYLRTTYNYCFWCGCQYNHAEDLKENCPGTEEDDH